MAAEIWLREAEDLTPRGFFGTMSGIGGPRATQHVTVCPSGYVKGTREQWFDRMVKVLRDKQAEPHFVVDPITDRVGQFGPCDKSSRSLSRGVLPGYSHNKVGSVNIQIEWVAQPDDFTRYWKPGKNIRALGRLLLSHGIRPAFVYRCATSGKDRVNVARPTRLLTSTTGGGCHWGHCHYGGGESHWDPNVDGTRFFAGLRPLSPVPPTPIPGTMEDAMLMFARIDSPTPAVANPVIVTDGVEARWIETSEDLTRLQKVLSGTTGKTPPIVKVDRLDGLAAHWYGPRPSDTYPIPEGWVL